VLETLIPVMIAKLAEMNGWKFEFFPSTLGKIHMFDLDAKIGKVAVTIFGAFQISGAYHSHVVLLTFPNGTRRSLPGMGSANPAGLLSICRWIDSNFDDKEMDDAINVWWERELEQDAFERWVNKMSTIDRLSEEGLIVFEDEICDQDIEEVHIYETLVD
jgi:hypothetical protein